MRKETRGSSLGERFRPGTTATKNHGITGMTNGSRSDKGKTRKITPEELLEAINAAKPHFHNKRYNKLALYRFCIEKGLLRPDQIAQTTFYRFIREYDLLANEEEENNNKKTPCFQHEVRQPTLASRHDVRTLSCDRCAQRGQKASQVDRLHR